MTQEELNKILENHSRWLNDCGGTQADLHGANLRVADLSRANLRGASLCLANLIGANLYRADLCGADLSGANLFGANLFGANLCGADLSGANLSAANLFGADLLGADLCGANLSGANLCAVDLCVAKNIPFIPYACPEFGVFIGFKKAGNKIVMLEIPEDAKRLSAAGRKCRCNKAKVLEIQNLDGTKAMETKVASNYDENFVYEVGETVSVSDFCEDRWEECSKGIHFFINRQEAVEY